MSLDMANDVDNDDDEDNSIDLDNSDPLTWSNTSTARRRLESTSLRRNQWPESAAASHRGPERNNNALEQDGESFTDMSHLHIYNVIPQPQKRIYIQNISLLYPLKYLINSALV